MAITGHYAKLKTISYEKICFCLSFNSYLNEFYISDSFLYQFFILAYLKQKLHGNCIFKYRDIMARTCFTI